MSNLKQAISAGLRATVKLGGLVLTGVGLAWLAANAVQGGGSASPWSWLFASALVLQGLSLLNSLRSGGEFTRRSTFTYEEMRAHSRTDLKWRSLESVNRWSFLVSPRVDREFFAIALDHLDQKIDSGWSAWQVRAFILLTILQGVWFSLSMKFEDAIRRSKKDD